MRNGEQLVTERVVLRLHYGEQLGARPSARREDAAGPEGACGSTDAREDGGAVSEHDRVVRALREEIRWLQRELDTDSRIGRIWVGIALASGFLNVVALAYLLWGMLL